MPAALAGVASILGVSLLPFWPPALAVAIVAAATAAAAFRPRLGLALALAAPVFPLGNVAEGLAVLYGALAVAWLLLFWTEARLGLLYVVGPLLAPFGALALVPLAVQPLAPPVRRGAQAAAAVLTAGVIVALGGDRLPLGGESLAPPDLAPASSVTEVAAALWASLLSQPPLGAAALVAGAVAVVLPWVRRYSRFGVAALGVGVIACSVAAGTGFASVPLLVAFWGLAAALAARTRR